MKSRPHIAGPLAASAGRACRASRWSLLAALAAGLSLSFSQTAQARNYDEDEEPPPLRRRRAPTLDPAEYRTEQYLALEFRAGPYRPQVDDEFKGGATPFEDTFGQGQSVFFGFEVDWQALRIPHFGSLGPGLGWAYVRYDADAKLTSSGKASKQNTNFWVMPVSGLAVLRVDVLAHDFGIPIVPYGKLGLTWAPWQAGDAGSTSTDAQGVKGLGSELGYEWHLGGALHLNVFAPQAALDMDNTTGVNHAYLFLEWQGSKVNSFGKGMDVGANTWAAGLIIEY